METKKPEKRQTGDIVAELIRATRSCRRYRQDVTIPRPALLEMIEAARLGGSARNLQPLKYLIVDNQKQCGLVFPHLGWAGYLDKWPGPEEGERPVAYIVCLLDMSLADEAAVDLGIASQNILLTATAMGYRGCRIASVSGRLAPLLRLPASLRIELVISLGVPKETVKLTSRPPAGDIRYWRDGEGVHYVPKRPLDEILIDHA